MTADGGADFERLLDELLDAHLVQFHTSHNRARADAAPSMMGAERSPDHYTFGYARRVIDACLGNVNRLIVTIADAQGRDPASLEAPARARVRGFLDEVLGILAREYERPPPGEFGLRPSPEALTQVRAHAEAMFAAAMAAAARGRLDARLVRKRSAMSALAERLGGGRRLFLILAAALVVLMIIRSL